MRDAVAAKYCINDCYINTLADIDRNLKNKIRSRDVYSYLLDLISTGAGLDNSLTKHPLLFYLRWNISQLYYASLMRMYKQLAGKIELFGPRSLTRPFLALTLYISINIHPRCTFYANLAILCFRLFTNPKARECTSGHTQLIFWSYRAWGMLN